MFPLNRKVEDLQFRVEEVSITKGDLEVNTQHGYTPLTSYLNLHFRRSGLPHSPCPKFQFT